MAEIIWHNLCLSKGEREYLMFTFAKGFLYKFCFCLGLGTATYYSYGTVQKWVAHDEVKVIENVVEKHVTRENQVYDDAYTPQEFSYEQPEAAPLMAEIANELKAPEAPVAAVEEKKEEEKKDENGEEKKDENSEEVAGGIIQNPNLPMTYAPQGGHYPASVENQQASADKPYAPEIPLLPNELPSPTPSSGSSSGYSGNGSSSGYVPTPGVLDNNDIAALISPLKASFDDTMNKANGMLCTVQAGPNGCERRNHIDVHSLRWGMIEGLKKDVKFSIKSAGGNTLEFRFDFKIQNTALNEELVSVVSRPVDTLVRNVSKDSKTYRVIEFRFSDLTVQGMHLKQVQAEMVYEVTSNGLVLSSDSGLSFVRTNVQTLVTKWEPLAGEPVPNPNPIAEPIHIDQVSRRTPAAQDSGVFLIADELLFSMSIEKSL